MALALAAAAALAGRVRAEDPSPYADHARLLVYRDEAGEVRPVGSREEWSRRREHILEGMQAAMGPLPDRSRLAPLDVQVLETFAGEGFTRLTLTFAADEKDRVPAHLYLPEGRPRGQRLPAMLALHPTGPLGKGIVAGLGERPNRAYALELALRGYVVLAPDYPSFGDYAYDFQADAFASGSMKGIFNHMRAVDLLQERDEVDPQRIGVIGHSLGGHNALFVAAFDERLKVIVSSCGWTPFHDYRQGVLAPWAQEVYMPRLREVFGLDPDRMPFDFYEVVASLAPRPFFSASPLGDDNFDAGGVRKAEAAAREVYRLWDAACRLQVRYPDCGHDFPPQTRREAYAFIDQALGHAPAADVPAAP